MNFRVGDKVRIIKPLYSDNPRLGEIMRVRNLRDESSVACYTLADNEGEYHIVRGDEIELIQGFRTFKEIEEINKNRSLKNNSIYEEVEEAVEHPKHYNKGKIEVIEVIEDWELNFSLGNVVKYIARCEHKEDKLKDLEKAKWYIQREIDSC